MYLLIDIGNQNAKWQFGDEKGTFPSRHSEFNQTLTQSFGHLNHVSGVLFVSVADQTCTNILQSFVTAKWNVEAFQVTPKEEQCGVRNCYREISELGADRWAALIGAWSVYQSAAVIVDCGTAVTVDALTAKGEFIGGSILPGFELARDSLWQRAPGIREFNALSPELPARSTVEAVSSGVVYTTVGGVELLVQKYSELVGGTPKLLLTGGTCSLITEHSSYNFEMVSNLTLIGLEVISRTIRQQPTNEQ